MTAELVSHQRCGFCRKAMFDKLYHCKQCSERCKRRCKHSGTQNCRRCSRRRTKTGEDHWTKVLQASEVNSNFVIMPCALSMGSHIVEVGDVCRCNRSGKPGKDTGVFSSLYDRFCQWLMSKRKSTPSSGMRGSGDKKTRKEPISPSWDLGYASFDEVVLSFPFETNSDSLHSRIHTMSSSDSCSCCSYSTTSSLSSATFAVSPTDGHITDIVDNYSPLVKPESLWKDEHEDEDIRHDKFFSLQLSRQTKFNERARERRHTSLTATLSCPPKPVSREQTTSRDSKAAMEMLCATWPLIGFHDVEYDSDCEGSGSVFGDDIRDEMFNSLSRPQSTILRDYLGDCTIPFSDLEFGECIRVGRRQQIHRGRWHGDVNIHTFRDQTDEEAKIFLTEVNTLSMIRHDNITLFMGACIERPTLAVVTDITRGPSLYQNIHMRAVGMVMRTKVQIVSEIAQAMGYLHAKGIILRRLNTKNVILEPKVKVSIMDHGMTEQKCDRLDRGCISRGHLTYIAPEILSTVRVEPPRLQTEAAFTRETDIFAFGTVLYEVFSDHFPYQGLLPETVIWQVCTGKRQSLAHIHCLSLLKDLIKDCWTHDPLYRPEFREVTKDLMNAALHKRHSSSEPEAINRSGFTRRNLYS